MKSLIICFLCLFISLGEKIYAQRYPDYPNEFIRRANDLYAEKDTVFYCYSGASYASPYSNVSYSGYIIYRHKRKWKAEIYVWKHATGELIYRNRKRNRCLSKSIDRVFYTIYTQYDSLSYYNHHSTLEKHPIYIDLGEGKHGIISNETMHYSYFYYKGKIGASMFVENNIKINSDPLSITYKYPTVGYFLTIVNSVYPVNSGWFEGR